MSIEIKPEALASFPLPVNPSKYNHSFFIVSTPVDKYPVDNPVDKSVDNFGGCG